MSSSASRCAVKPQLMLNPIPQPDGSATVVYNFVLDPVQD